MAHRSVENALRGAPDMTSDPAILSQVQHLVDEAQLTIQAIRKLGEVKAGDALTDPDNLTDAVRLGILDAPQLKNNPYAPGLLSTRVLNGSCVAIDADGKPIGEAKRLANYL
jgi:hypothetical protein